MRLNAFAVLSLVLVVAGCSPAQEAPDASVTPPSFDLAKEAAAIKALEAKWSALYNDKNVEGIAALMAEESVFLPPGREAAIGIEAVVQANRELIAAEAEQGVSVSWESTSAVVSPSGDMAFDYGIATTVLPDGSTVSGHYLAVWVREGGEWKIAADIYN